MAVTVRVLGPVAVWEADGRLVELGHARQRCVLAVLAVESNQPVTVDQLLDRVWSGRLPQRGRDVVYNYLSRLRSALAGVPGVTIERHAGGYMLVVAEAAVDVHRFRQLVRDARSADDETALAYFDEALNLWRDTAFGDLDTPWLASVRTTLEAERRAAELDRTDVALRRGRHSDLVAELAARVEQNSLDERLAGQLMLALYRAGRQADALAQYQHLRAELAEQLGTDPNPAVRDLHQKILAAAPELAIPTTSEPVPRQLPPAPTWFTGRDSELATLTSGLGDTMSVFALGGAGGIGKTWLALHWAHQHLDRFPDGQLFVDLRGFSPDSDPLDPLTALRGFLDALGVDTASIGGGVDEHAARYRSQITGKRMLILLDNAATADQIVPLLPGTPSCTVLFTSRTILTTLLTRHGARHLNLDVLSSAEAQSLLVRRLGHARVAAEPDVVAELIRRCGGYPLALGVMASRAQAHPQVPLADFAAELHLVGLEALDDADPVASLPAVLSWSLRGLTVEQRTVFALLGVVTGPDIGLLAAASLTNLAPSRVRTVLRDLVDASLVQRRTHGRYAMHDLIRAYAATAAQDLATDVRELALDRVLDYYTRTAHTADHLLNPLRTPIELDSPVPGAQSPPLADTDAALDWFDVEHHALLAAQRTAAVHGRHLIVWQIAWALATFHYRRGHVHDDLAVWQFAVASAEYLPDPTAGIFIHRFLGRAQTRVGHHEAATEQLYQALALAGGHDRTQEAHTQHELAVLWEWRGDNRRALEHARHALNLYRELDNPVREADALNAVGWFSASLGEYDTAREHCAAALALHRNNGNTEGEAVTLDSLGYIAHLSGNHRQAIDHYRQSVALFRALGHTYEVGNTLANLGRPHAALGEGERARTVWQEALHLYQQQGRDDDADRVQRDLDGLDLDHTPTGRQRL